MGLSAGMLEPRPGEALPWQYAIYNTETGEIVDTFLHEENAKISLQVLPNMTLNHILIAS